jgi:hypothetical protein
MVTDVPDVKTKRQDRLGGVKYECLSCGYQTSVIARTIFQDTHKPLTLWFRAIWYITSQKNGTSALGLQRILGLGSLSHSLDLFAQTEASDGATRT